MNNAEKYCAAIKTLETNDILSLIERKYSFETWLMEATKELMIRLPKFRNPLPVVVVMVPNESGGLLMIRRSDNGLLALPGGYQNLGETWQEAAIREVKEETGQDIIRPELVDVITANGVNLLFCKVQPIEVDLTLPHDEEVMEILIIKQTPWADDIAFETHHRMVDDYFWRYE